MTDVENIRFNIRLVLIAIGVTWTAGTAVTLWAANQENRLSNLEEIQIATKNERTELKESLKELVKATTELNTNVRLLDQRVKLQTKVMKDEADGDSQ